MRLTSRFRFGFAACSLVLSLGQGSATTTYADDVAAPKSAASPFVVKPYLQFGANPAADRMDVLWVTSDVDGDWRLEYQPGSNQSYRAADRPTFRSLKVDGVAPQRIYRVTLTGLEAGGQFGYRVLREGSSLFASQGKAIKSADQPYKFVVFGDIAAGTTDQKPIAYRAFASNPDFLMVTGDIVYDRGRASEYRDRYWNVYNNTDDPSPTVGVPMMRSVPFAAAPGNHDTATRDLDRYPDGLSYFYYWAQPLNGPDMAEGSSLTPKLTTDEAHRKAFTQATGAAYPRMANFSFDYGNAHWLVLDANPYVDWSDKELKAWVDRDLAEHQSATWRFVSFHQPGFNSAREHYEQQHMRTLAPIFEKNKVSIVFNGHVHNYQRSFPIKFKPDNEGALIVAADRKTPRGRIIGGPWVLDKKFDGVNDTTPEGVIYIITGAGGQDLYNPEQQDDPATWQGFTDKFVSKVHSLTTVEVEGKTLKIKQLTAEGTELDGFTITQ